MRECSETESRKKDRPRGQEEAQVAATGKPHEGRDLGGV